MTVRTIFEVYWYGMTSEAQDAWVKRTIWSLAKTLQETYWSKALLEGADDIVVQTLERLLLDPTGEYAPRLEATAQEYFRRCLWVRIKAVARMARAGKRRYIGANHVELDELHSRTPVADGTPESMLTDREELREAQIAISKAIANSRLRGVTRQYAENFVHFAEQGLGTAEIAKRFNTNEANVRSARRRLMQVLEREGVIAKNSMHSLEADDRPDDRADVTFLSPTTSEPRH